jgi:hypothetical protein
VRDLLQMVSHVLLASRQRRTMMASAPLTVQCMPDCCWVIDVEGPAAFVVCDGGRSDDRLDVTGARLAGLDVGRVRDDEIGRLFVGMGVKPSHE